MEEKLDQGITIQKINFQSNLTTLIPKQNPSQQIDQINVTDMVHFTLYINLVKRISPKDITSSC